MGPQPEPCRVLVVEDDEEDYLITRDLLARQDRTRFEVEWRDSYDQALAAIREQRHDVYLVDYRLGEHNGLQLVRTAFSSPAHAPVIVLTGRDRHDVDMQASALGVSDYLIKHELHPDSLERAIRYAIAHHRVLKDLSATEARYAVAANAAEEATSLHEAVLETTQNAYVAIDAEGTITAWNRAAEQIFGWARSEALGRELVTLIIPERHRAAHSAGFRRYLTTGEANMLGRRLELDALRSDRTEFPIELTITAAQRQGCRTFHALIADISDRKRAEARLQEAEERFRQGFDHAPIGMSLTSLDGVFLRANRALTEMLGRPLAGVRIEDVTHPDDRERDAAARGAMAAGSQANFRTEKRYLHADGSPVWVSLSASVVRDECGTPQYFVSQMEDICERKGAEQRFQQLLEFAPDAIIGIDDAGRIVLSNVHAETLFGYPREELHGMPVHTLVPDLDRVRHRDTPLEQSGAMTPRSRLELPARRHDGTEFPAEISLSSISTNEGTLAIAAVRDISERREIEAVRRLAERLAESEALLSAGEALTAGGSFERDLRTGEARYSPGLAKILGLPADDLAPSREAILERIHPDDLEHVKECSARAEQGREPVSYQTRVIRADGAVRTLRIRAQAVFDELGKAVKLLGAAHDVTEEQELLAARELLSYVVDSSDDAILTKTAEGLITSWNRGAERLYGYGAAEAIGQPLSLIVPPERESEQERLIGKTFAGESIERFETERLRKDGSRVLLSLTISPVRDANGRIVSAAAIARDITEQKRIEKELRRSNEDLEQFAYVASHDLSEPLRVISGFVELLARRYRGQLDDDADRFIQFTIGGVERMQLLINDLLEYSRARRAELELSEVEAAALVGDILHTLSDQIEERGTQVEVGPLPTVRAQPTLLRQVFQNLISNAVKFTDGEHPRVRISASARADRWLFEVMDNGPGIPTHQESRVFEMFQRLHGREVPGSGMGLAIARRVIERHGGTIWVQPGEGGVGSAFRFTIPARRATRAGD